MLRGLANILGRSSAGRRSVCPPNSDPCLGRAAAAGRAVRRAGRKPLSGNIDPIWLYFFFSWWGCVFPCSLSGARRDVCIPGSGCTPTVPARFHPGQSSGLCPIASSSSTPKKLAVPLEGRSPGVLGLLFPYSPRECSAGAQEVPARSPAELEANLSFHPCHRSSLRIISVGFNSELNFPALNGVSALLGP